MTQLSNQLRQALKLCPPGQAGWATFERVAQETLDFLLVPPLQPSQPQVWTLQGVERRDAVFSNRERDTSTNWGLLHADHKARLILVEFKNYDRTEIGADEVDQASNYLREPWGKLAILCCNKLPNPSAHRRRNTIFSDSGKVILFLTTNDLLEMLDIKDRGEDPSGFIIDSVELFLLRHD
jgi:hypothetical protein